jgi:HSP20 family protein
MPESTDFQLIPINMYRTLERLTIAAPMPGLEPEDILVEVTEDGQLIIHGDVRGTLKGAKEVLLNEWNVGGYHRELTLPEAVDGEHANVTYGNGVLVIALLSSQNTLPARITLAKTGTAHGEYRGNMGGHPQE